MKIVTNLCLHQLHVPTKRIITGYRDKNGSDFVVQMGQRQTLQGHVVIRMQCICQKHSFCRKNIYHNVSVTDCSFL
jgi:hypothetical protein